MTRAQWLWTQASLAVIANAAALMRRDARAEIAEAKPLSLPPDTEE